MLQILPRGRSAMKGGRSAMLQTFRAEGLQGGRSAIQHRQGCGRIQCDIQESTATSRACK